MIFSRFKVFPIVKNIRKFSFFSEFFASILSFVSRLFVRTYYHVNGLTDIEYAVTQSPEVTTARLDSAADFLPRPMLSVARLDVQMVMGKKIDQQLCLIIDFRRCYRGNCPILKLSHLSKVIESI